MQTKKSQTISIIFLVIITLGLIATFSNYKFNGASLNVNGNPANAQNPTPFTYLNARSSSVNNVVYENNFGGTKNDELHEVFELEHFYIIGTTQSKDYYFQDNKCTLPTIFVFKQTKQGKCVHVSLTPLDYNFTYIASHIASNGIYILTSSTILNSTVVLLYDFYDGSLSEVLNIPFVYPLSITINENNIIIAGIIHTNKLCFYFYNKQQNELTFVLTNSSVTTILLFAPYQNGALVFFNSLNSFSIFYVNATNYTAHYNISNFTLKTFDIIGVNFLLVLYSNSSTQIVLLNSNFEQLNTATLNIASHQFFITSINNAYYLFFKYNELLSIIILSKNADIVLEINSNIAIQNFLSVKSLGTNLLLTFTTQENLLCILTLDKLLNTTKTTQFAITSIVMIDYFYQSDGFITFFGNASLSTTIITHNFGQKDLFVFKYNYS